jgi:hypothetical protein
MRPGHGRGNSSTSQRGRGELTDEERRRLVRSEDTRKRDACPWMNYGLIPPQAFRHGSHDAKTSSSSTRGVPRRPPSPLTLFSSSDTRSTLSNRSSPTRNRGVTSAPRTPCALAPMRRRQWCGCCADLATHQPPKRKGSTRTQSSTTFSSRRVLLERRWPR